MIAAESNVRDVPNLFKNDWSSVKEVEEKIAAQKAKEKAEREERERQAQAKREADAKKTQAEKDLEARIKSIEDEKKAKLEEAGEKVEKAEQQARTATEKVTALTRDRDTWQTAYSSLAKRLAAYDGEYYLKKSFNHRLVWLCPPPGFDDRALVLVNEKYTTRPPNTGNVSPTASLDLVNDSEPDGPWTIRVNGSYLEMITNADGTPVILSPYDGGGFKMKVVADSSTRLGGDRGKGQEWIIALVEGYISIQNVRFKSYMFSYDNGNLYAINELKGNLASNRTAWKIIVK